MRRSKRTKQEQIASGEWVLNPKSVRFVKVGGETYSKLVTVFKVF